MKLLFTIFVLCIISDEIVSIKFLGCYEPPSRLSHDFSFNLTELTADECFTKCSNANYKYAILEMYMCYCKHSKNGLNRIYNNKECNFYCKGKSFSCGGRGRASAYDLLEDQCKPEFPLKGLEENDKYIGCIKLKKKTDIFRHNFTTECMSYFTCFSECRSKGFIYAGISNGVTCFCGNGHYPFNDKIPEPQCDILCMKSTNVCGGENSVSVFHMGLECTKVQPDYSNEYLGCYLDEPKRHLSIKTPDKELVPQKCIVRCREKGYLYAGLQYGIGCWCGNQEQFLEDRRPESECSSKCLGNKNLKCGGFFRNSLYKTGVCAKAKQSYNREELFLGCFKADNVDKLAEHKFVFINSKIDICFHRCRTRGFRYAWLQAGTICRCSNVNLPITEKTNEEDCNILCKDGLDKCGGNYTVNVYNLLMICEKVEPLNNVVYLGCYKDETKRLLEGHHSSGNMSPKKCIAKCQSLGFLYAGVQFSHDCWCGNQEQLLENRISENKCDKVCSGDKNSICGGLLLNSIYQASTCALMKYTSREVFHLGCYSLHNSSISGYSYKNAYMSTQDCINECEKKHFEYAMLENGENCFCTNNKEILTNKVADDQCDSVCKLDKFRCGGNNKVSLYGLKACTAVQPNVENALYYGCFEDKRHRTLTEYKFKDPKMTPRKCFKECQKQGYYYAALQYGQACYCASYDITLLKRKNDKDCNMKCAGDNTKHCGGFFRNAIYIMRQCLSILQRSHHDRSIYIGCYNKIKSMKHIVHHSFEDNSMTSVKCITECRNHNYMFAALNSGFKCTCWNDHSFLKNRVDEDQCNLVCPGNNFGRCGGEEEYSLYSMKCKKAVPIEKIIYIGCFQDTLERKLKGHYLIRDQLSYKHCFRICQSYGFIYAALQERTHCFCGSQTEIFTEKVQGDKCKSIVDGIHFGSHLYNAVYAVGQCSHTKGPEEFPKQTTADYSMHLTTEYNIHSTLKINTSLPSIDFLTTPKVEITKNSDDYYNTIEYGEVEYDEYEDTSENTSQSNSENKTVTISPSDKHSKGGEEIVTLPDYVTHYEDILTTTDYTTNPLHPEFNPDYEDQNQHITTEHTTNKTSSKPEYDSDVAYPHSDNIDDEIEGNDHYNDVADCPGGEGENYHDYFSRRPCISRKKLRNKNKR